MTGRTRPFLVALSLVVAIGALAWWIADFDVSGAEVAQLAGRLKWWILAPLFVLLAGHVALSAWRWALIEEALCGVRPRFAEAFSAGGIALGLGTFLPATVVNVACRAIANRLSGTSGLRGAVSGAIDQIADLLAVLLVALPAALAFLAGDLRLYLWGSAGMVVLGALFVAALPALSRWDLLQRKVIARWQIGQLLDRGTLLRLYAISLLRVLNLTLMTLAIHFASGAGTIAAVIISVPLVTLAISAAMLPGGLGVSEWSFSAVFAGLGIGAEEIVLFVLANRLVLTGLSFAVMGLALIVLWGRVADRRDSAASCRG